MTRLCSNCEIPVFIDLERPRFNPKLAMISRTVGGMSYHSGVQNGTVHLTRESLDFAVALLAAGEQPTDAGHATRIIRQVVALQDTDDQSATYGIWPLYLEEPISRMGAPDHNWADFIGARLAHILAKFADELDSATRSLAASALERATTAIVRRDITPDYTNIAVMGAGVAATAGEIAARHDWTDYAIRKLSAVLESFERNGSFPEYNSPTYTLLVVEECERIGHLVRDRTVLALADRLFELAWQCIADHWHPGTQQWAGPHARTYDDLLSPSRRERIAAAVESPDILRGQVRSAATSKSVSASCVVPVRPCPAALRERFESLPGEPYICREVCQRGLTSYPDRVATTWFSADACLGSFSRHLFWTQTRALLGYFAGPGGIGVFRARMLHDGVDFASGGLVQAQSGPRVLSLAHFWTGAGSFHPYFGRNDRDAFEIKQDLRLRIQLVGDQATVSQAGPGRWTFAYGRHLIHLLTADVTVNGQLCPWQGLVNDHGAAVEVILYKGPSELCLRTTSLCCAFATEVSVGPSPSRPTVTLDQGRIEAHWPSHDDLIVIAPRVAQPLAW